MAEILLGTGAGDPWLADQLVSNLGFDGAIQFCRVRAWDRVLDHVIALKETDEAIPTALDRPEAIAAPAAFPTMPDPMAERETLELAAAGAAEVLGPDHGTTQALAKAAITMDKADLWRAKLSVKKLSHDQREAIAEVAEI
ncbi:MAG: hypothetical protein V3R90_15910 [Limibaculum sp.]